jgi:hypothetical protein
MVLLTRAIALVVWFAKTSREAVANTTDGRCNRESSEPSKHLVERCCGVQCATGQYFRGTGFRGLGRAPGKLVYPKPLGQK